MEEEFRIGNAYAALESAGEDDVLQEAIIDKMDKNICLPTALFIFKPVNNHSLEKKIIDKSKISGVGWADAMIEDLDPLSLKYLAEKEDIIVLKILIAKDQEIRSIIDGLSKDILHINEKKIEILKALRGKPKIQEYYLDNNVVKIRADNSLCKDIDDKKVLKKLLIKAEPLRECVDCFLCLARDDKELQKNVIDKISQDYFQAPRTEIRLFNVRDCLRSDLMEYFVSKTPTKYIDPYMGKLIFAGSPKKQRDIFTEGDFFVFKSKVFDQDGRFILPFIYEEVYPDLIDRLQEGHLKDKLRLVIAKSEKEQRDILKNIEFKERDVAVDLNMIQQEIDYPNLIPLFLSRIKKGKVKSDIYYYYRLRYANSDIEKLALLKEMEAESVYFEHIGLFFYLLLLIFLPALS